MVHVYDGSTWYHVVPEYHGRVHVDKCTITMVLEYHGTRVRNHNGYVRTYNVMSQLSEWKRCTYVRTCVRTRVLYLYGQ